VTVSDTITGDPTATDQAEAPAAARRWRPIWRPTWWPAARPDLAVLGCYLSLAVFVTGRFWVNPSLRMSPWYQADPSQAQWFLVHAARVVTRLENPFFTTQMNVPGGVNLMANTSVLGIGIPLAPVTLLFGPQVSFILFITLALAGTAFAWYHLLSRHVVTSRWAAVLGGVFCGFAPGMISHASWHPNIVAQFLVPVIVWRVIRLREPGHTLRNGLILGLLIAYQAFINQEILFITALAVGVFVIAHRLLKPEPIANVVRGLAVAAAVAVVLLAYPLYLQFFGQQSYHGLHDSVQIYRADVLSYGRFASESVAGNANGNGQLVPNRAEESTFFGWPVLVLAGVLIFWLWRSTLVRALAVTGGLFGVLAFGTRLAISGHPTRIPGPWLPFSKLPLFDSVVPVRLGLVVIPVIGVLLALGAQRIRDMGGSVPAARPVWTIALVMALLPAAPTPVTAVNARPVPRFITSGAWREHATGGRTVVPVPLTSYPYPDAMRWAAAAGLEFSLPRGYFLAPKNGVQGAQGQFGAPWRPTASLLERVAGNGKVPTITDLDRQHAQEDLRYWNAGVVVLTDRQPHADRLLQVLLELLGPATRADDVWIWDVAP
jgi:hypothetical protein